MFSSDKCDKYRNILKAWEDFDDEIPILAGEIELGAPNLPELQPALQHVQNCEHCKVWLESKIPVELKLQQERAKKYCCDAMFCAVEDQQDDQLQISFSYLKGETFWCISNFDFVSAMLIISFCPWCGSKMPEQQFVDSL